MSVSVQQVSKRYGQQMAVDGISFEAKPGQILGFLGPNGAGKSTTMKMITGFLRPSSGTIRVCGHDVQAEALAAKRQIGYLPEQNPLYKDLYVREYLHFAARTQGLRQSSARIAELLRLTGLEREQHKRIGQLSKGYRQRVGLAQALLHDPQVLILDEPTSGLDPNQLVDIRALIKALGRDKTLILSTHIMQEVQALCDEVLIIKQGKMVAHAPIGQLSQLLSGRRVVEVEFKEVLDRSAFDGLPGLLDCRAEGRKFLLDSADDEDLRPAVFQLAIRKGYTLIGLRELERGLEDVFRQLTQ